MLKMYHEEDHSGSTPDYWEGTWDGAEFEKAVSFCSIDPLRRLFEKYLRPDSLMLEGGCGMGNYVTYYSARGFRVIGLDFAQRTLKTLKGRQPTLELSGGDVSCLPFADKTFDLYYSGGVVEHFEGGPEASLHEARRVLKEDGILMISVPYQSPLRSALTPLKNGEWLRVRGSSIDEFKPLVGKEFFQYVYRTNEFRQILSEAGLRVIETQGYAILWGLYDLGRQGVSGKKPVSAGPPSTTPDRDIASLIQERPLSLPKRLVVNEDESVPLLGLGVRFMRWAAANMMMYVCERA